MEPRSSQFVLSKLSGLLYGSQCEAGLRQYWMPDDISLECYECTSKFTSFRRRHHCRVCGQVFCSRCCSHYIPGRHASGHSSPSLRVCSFCFRSYQAVLERGAPPDPDTVGQAGPTAQFRRRQSIDQAAQLSSGGGGAGSRRGSGGQEAGQGERVRLRDPGTLARLWARVLEPELGVRLETHRYYLRAYPGSFPGSRLVAWLLAQDRHTDHAQAVAIGQALLSAGFMSAVSGQQQFSDSSELYQPVEPGPGPPEPQAEPLQQQRTVEEPAWLQDLPNYPLEQPEDSKVAVTAQRTEECLPDGHIEVDVGDLQESVVECPESAGEDCAEQLDAVYRKHEAAYLTTLLEAERIPACWRDTLCSLAQRAVATVRPELRRDGDEVDILSCVKVKCVAGGERGDCRLVEGEVCSLQLTHKDMASSLTRPRIALVAESIMFKDRNTMVSLETIKLQEAEYVKNVIGKLLEFRPSLVLVEKTVTYLAQEMLLREGVSLVVNVKPKLLGRLTRLTGGSIIQSVDTMLSQPKLGTCRQVSSQPQGNNSRLLIFEGCDPGLGVTLLLRGGDRPFLSRLKAVLRRLVLLKFNWIRERSLLANEYGSLLGAGLDWADGAACQLAISPFIRIPRTAATAEDTVPYALEARDTTEEEEESVERKAEPAEGGADSPRARPEVHPATRGFLQHRVTSLGCSGWRDSLALSRAAGWRLNHAPTRPARPPPRHYSVLLPEDHTEVLAVQFSMYSKQSQVAPNYCVAPWVVDMQLYSTLDMALGEFLDSLCFSSEYRCPNKQCSTPPVLHTRRFCHAGGAVTLHMQQLEAPIMGEDKLMMWKYCTSCELITNIVPVSDLTWSFSFAMFLHLLLHESRLVRRGAGRPDATCIHSLHQEHLTCFGKKDQVVTFRYSELRVMDLSTPAERLQIPRPAASRAALTARLQDLMAGGSSLFSAVLARLHGVAAGECTGLVAERDRDHRQYRDRVQQLEERISSGVAEQESEEVELLLARLQRDLLAWHQAWQARLAELPAKKATLDQVDPNTKKADSDTTVKKLISTILPQSEDSSLAWPGPADCHLLTHVAGLQQNPRPLTCVSETKPSTVISFLLSSPQYREFLEREQEGGQADTEHLVLEMSDSTTKFYCCSYFTSQFHALRGLLLPDCGEANFARSLSNCTRWEAMGGKSGLLFYKTTDDRFVLKQMSRFEYQSFLEFAPHYFQYITQSIVNGVKTLLCKILGVFKVGFKNSASGSGMNMEFLVMENLFFGREVSRSYDLKGSVRNRLITEGDGQQGQVLLDENLLRVSCESPLYINQQDKDLLNEALRRDAMFLASHQMMDYSLLAGICDSDNKLVVGIIDYIRTFTWDKKLETLVKSVSIKSSGVFGGPAKTPTVINPDLYQVRFTEAMNRYFSVVPP